MGHPGFLDLNDALQHPGRKVSVDIWTEFPEEADLDLAEPLEGSLDAVSTGNLLLVTGEFRTRCVVECARCGAPLTEDVSFQMSEQFPVEGVASMYNPEDHARVVEEEDYPLFQGNSLNVEALVRQGLITNLPVQPLCEFGWEGDCPNARGLRREGQTRPGRAEFQVLERLTDPNEGPA
jgi:uncharacterized protein